MTRVVRLPALLLCAVAAVSPAVFAAEPCEALINQSNAQLEAMRRHTSAIEESVEQLSESLRRAERRNAEQTREIERLEAELRAQRAVSPEEHERQRREFFRALRRALPPSTLYEILSDRVIVAADPVFIHRTGDIGGEGQDRLTPLADALRGVVAQMPEEFPWRLRIEGHSDVRPLRSSQRFESNWELSSARAVGFLRFLVTQGLPEDRLTAVGMADTRVRDVGESTAAHRRNRRLEVHLVYGSLPPS